MVFFLQLILPECMKLLPLYTNCILKNDILLGGESHTFLVIMFHFRALSSSKINSANKLLQFLSQLLLTYTCRLGYRLNAPMYVESPPLLSMLSCQHCWEAEDGVFQQMHLARIVILKIAPDAW